LGQQTLEEALGCRLVAAFLQQDIELSTMLVDGAPQQIRLTADIDEDLVEMPRCAGSRPGLLYPMGKVRAELVTPPPGPPCRTT
jgi:hypothetical protein